ncbi:MAG: uracil-DNA glycosylase [Candidatus Firestonebacteria bacterium]|nr:uracil-DNA glycosylase [Candidatus Firestonebacteria bacterium]
MNLKDEIHILKKQFLYKIEMINEMGIPAIYEDTSKYNNNREEIIIKLNTEIKNCVKCGLHKTRTNAVPGEGDINAKLVFIGEAPGEEEDKEALPFIGAAGQLLSKIINAMGLKREDVYICNVLKCRPPENRNPENDEILACESYLHKQLEIIKPEVICTLGNFACHVLLHTEKNITSLRGKIYTYYGIKVIPTLHPAACLYNPANKKLVWEDIQKIMKIFRRIK